MDRRQPSTIPTSFGPIRHARRAAIAATGAINKQYTQPYRDPSWIHYPKTDGKYERIDHGFKAKGISAPASSSNKSKSADGRGRKGKSRRTPPASTTASMAARGPSVAKSTSASRGKQPRSPLPIVGRRQETAEPSALAEPSRSRSASIEPNSKSGLAFEAPKAQKTKQPTPTTAERCIPAAPGPDPQSATAEGSVIESPQEPPPTSTFSAKVPIALTSMGTIMQQPPQSNPIQLRNDLYGGPGPSTSSQRRFWRDTAPASARLSTLFGSPSPSLGSGEEVVPTAINDIGRPSIASPYGPLSTHTNQFPASYPGLSSLSPSYTPDTPAWTRPTCPGYSHPSPAVGVQRGPAGTNSSNGTNIVAGAFYGTHPQHSAGLPMLYGAHAPLATLGDPTPTRVSGDTHHAARLGTRTGHEEARILAEMQGIQQGLEAVISTLATLGERADRLVAYIQQQEITPGE